MDARAEAVKRGLSAVYADNYQSELSLPGQSGTERFQTVRDTIACKAVRLPHPIPYQGSKRGLAPLIGPCVPTGIETWYEPFAGSAAMTLWAASHNVAKRYVIGDVLAPIAELWRMIIESPRQAYERYAEIWNDQSVSGDDYFNVIRDRYNRERHPIDLLYLICRCVKNAIRFNPKNGNFTQSRDKRRLGMRPERMGKAICGASALLKDRTQVIAGDWRTTLDSANARDFVYMDPPYLGTTTGRDKRYVEGLARNSLIEGIADLRARNIRFALSYDGMTGNKEYGPPLPESLGLTRLLLHAGKSSQATLLGRSEDTVESLYLSPGLGSARSEIIRKSKAAQESLAF